MNLKDTHTHHTEHLSLDTMMSYNRPNTLHIHIIECEVWRRTYPTGPRQDRPSRGNIASFKPPSPKSSRSKRKQKNDVKANIHRQCIPDVKYHVLKAKIKCQVDCVKRKKRGSRLHLSALSNIRQISTSILSKQHPGWNTSRMSSRSSWKAYPMID